MTTTTLKLIALALMFVDHIAEFIPNIPVWFHWLGRLSAPIFMFCMVWGFEYTKNRKKYLIRMYLFSVAMALSNLIFNQIYIDRAYQYIINNIFTTLFLIAVICYIIEQGKKDRKTGTKLWAGFILWQVLSTVISVLSTQLFPQYTHYESPVILISTITANIFTAEGSFIMVFLGVLLYFNKYNKKSLITAYASFCVIYFAISAYSLHVMGFGITELFTLDYQWMMIFSLPFMLSYNGQKGKGLKYLFYIFYPAHIIILFLIGNTMI